ncbi:hypothetical protein [Mucilaginibacter rubeus]|uniref:Uncharacterized protein n=1 Tax=Mucilaginibacter rubeus TaxID=2027860 RepID=A0A5C1HYF0_9SPHI|nr:hypothetical protein [Mucilaginibacter rubeus]QEM10804.1 hypothetical protein DEO27_012475 [Mucilaginibacter rubeus]
MTSPPRHCCKERSNPLQAGNVLRVIKLASSRSWPRGARYFCLDTKVPKKSSQQGGFFALPSALAIASALTLQNKQNHGLQLFCPASHALPQRFCKNLLCPILRYWPPLFCLFSPEAFLLTENTPFFLTCHG